MALKLTFSFDEVTAGRLNEAAARVEKPKSEVVREAIRDYDARHGRLSESERVRMVRFLEDYMRQPPTRTAEEVKRELRDIRMQRRRWMRREPA